ncbi:hypothetical protein BKA62DRAFT_769862 [Auriculariales sp. MPI-PUGE-AT-0066]|nr:hypothetical protein BKA62DRAFT_769862 [Auriculariales sp. MPI-PUGE-AT-0066]
MSFRLLNTMRVSRVFLRTLSSKAATSQTTASRATTLSTKSSNIPEGYQLMFDGVAPRWSRWTFLFVGLIVLSSGNLAEGILHLRQKPTIKGEENLPEADWELRPLWQRAAGASLFLGMGVAASLIAFTARNRNAVRVLIRHSKTKGQPSLIMVEGGGSREGRGYVFELADCKVGPGRIESEITIHSKTSRMPWWPFIFDFSRGDVPAAGAEASAWDKRQAFMQTWENKEYRQLTRRVQPLVNQY